MSFAERSRPRARAEASRAYFFLPFRLTTGPYCLRAWRSQALRLAPCFLWQAFSARASFCARVRVFVFAHPVTVAFVVWLITAPSCAVRAVGSVRDCPQRLFFALAGRFVARTE